MGNIDTKKAVRIKQLDRINDLFRHTSIEEVKKLADDAAGTQRDVLDAILLFKVLCKPVYITGYEDPRYDDGRALVKRAWEAGDIDALRLMIYIETGLSVKVKPKRERTVKELYEELYRLTGDEEITPILENYDEYRIAYLMKYEDARYSMACEDYAPSYGGGSHDESYYENIIRHEENNKKD